jgi:hypothetical protein
MPASPITGGEPTGVLASGAAHEVEAGADATDEEATDPQPQASAIRPPTDPERSISITVNAPSDTTLFVQETRKRAASAPVLGTALGQLAKDSERSRMTRVMPSPTGAISGRKLYSRPAREQATIPHYQVKCRIH